MGGAELEDPVLEEDLQRTSEHRARELLDAEVEKLRSLGVTLAQAHLVEGGVAQEIVGLAEEIEAGLIVIRRRGDQKGLDGERLRLCSAAQSLPPLSSPRE